MLPFLMHLLLLPVAGALLFRLWRATRSEQRLVNAVIAVSVIGRSLAAQILFWISYMKLPFAPRLQMGDGLWFFGSDALLYFPTARRLVHGGMKAIIFYGTGGPSVAFVKALAVAFVLFGEAMSVAVLLNLFCYLGTMAVIVHWMRKEPRARLAAAMAVCAISFSPALFLWSLQPLKDTFFQFVVVSFICAGAAWQRAWAAATVRPWNIGWIAAAMFFTLLAIAGVRWYFALALLIAATVFLLLIAALSPARKSFAFAACAVLVVLLSRAFLFGGGTYVPPPILKALAPWAHSRPDDLPPSLLVRIDAMRKGFEKVGGTTTIGVGSHIAAREEESPAPDSSAAPPPAPPMPKSVAARLLTGTASVFLPRGVGERLGLFHIGGGQGLLWFTELDTVVFDAVFLWAVFAIAVQFSVSWRNPLVLLLALLTLFVTIPLAYTVTNYGTLFRLRAMIYSAILLIPIALATLPRRERIGAN